MDMNLKGKNVLVIGAGISGQGAARLIDIAGGHIIMYDGNDKLNEADVRAKLPQGCDAEIVIGAWDPVLVQKIDLAVISPGVPTDLPFVLEIKEADVPLWGELELAYQFEKGNVLAITGTNGKTTTTSLLGHIMRHWKEQVYVVGNIGTAYTTAVTDTTPDSVTVAEVSSFQLETIQDFHPMVSAILNITPDHLNRHYTMENYASIKENITMNQDICDSCILNFEDEMLREFGDKMMDLGKTDILYFSSEQALEHGLYLDGEEIVYDDGMDRTVICNIRELNLIGKHNYENVMAAVGMALRAEVPVDVIHEALTTFHAVAHRMEFSGEKNGVRYYNDSKGTNTDAAIKAIQAMDCPTYLIGGGYDKGADYTDWIKAFDGKVKKLVLIGATRENIRDCAEANGFYDCILMDTFEEAFAYCSDHAQPGEAVLLSPACASWGMFKNYEVRGDRFKELVAAL